MHMFNHNQGGASNELVKEAITSNKVRSENMI